MPLGINGERRDPTREEMRIFHETNHLTVKGKNRDYARDDLDDFILAFEGMKTLCKIMRYLINTGWTIGDIKNELHSSAESQETILANRGGKLDWESEQYSKWRENAWTDLQRQSRFVRRAIRGAFRAHSYTYFRPEIDYEGTVFLNPLALFACREEGLPSDLGSLYLQELSSEAQQSSVRSFGQADQQSEGEPRQSTRVGYAHARGPCQVYL